MPKKIRDHKINNLGTVEKEENTKPKCSINLINAGVLQNAIFNSANFSCIATDAKGVIQIFNVGAEHMLGYSAAQSVINKITPADISDSEEIIAHARSIECRTYPPPLPPDSRH
jgi:PAS domain-containing protein